MANEKKVVVRKEFNLARDDGSVVNYRAGTHAMPAEDAKHWYTRLHIEGGDEQADIAENVDPITGANKVASPTPEGGEGGTGDDAGVDIDGDGIDDMTIAQLKDELRARDLAVTGNKDELVQRLRDDDEAKAEGQ